MAQGNEGGKEKTLYNPSKTLIENELKYSPNEKVCLALFYAIKKLMHYFNMYSIRLISHADLTKFMMSRPLLFELLATRPIVFNQYKIENVPPKAIKGQTLANFLADYPLSVK
ncbi:hypothetical protein Sango_0250500 [Sesamum angolense]|uniref:Reverse transcriptase RNase H-like domain-containing protein n=1 Tax=Sesamum angolense TaxID=2727404 RepID=A0AAE1XH48_9LAMI|nr:hypothetical protein Sango_0250500 [Sesamum angolense]